MKANTEVYYRRVRQSMIIGHSRSSWNTDHALSRLHLTAGLSNRVVKALCSLLNESVMTVEDEQKKPQ